MKLFPTLVSEEAADYAGRVRVLSPEVAHRIAAGEVIERPASAVKELVENSLDAGASRVEVEIGSGGMALIRVSDDGSGMPPEDAARAVTEHATSKIRTADDLASVVSLGFRGEALHAIGAVSDLTLTTRERGKDDSLGARVRVFAGKMVESATAAHSPGTTVEVRDLFLNLPVRRGFLGTVRAETNAVATVVESLALSRPEVGFFLRSDGRRSLAFPAAADLRERISQVHGLSLARRLVALEARVVWVFASPLAITSPPRRYLHVAVNGRVVEADSFAPAVAKAYADLLPKGRHPAAFLRLELGPGEVDVNVHPAKSAVRLRGGRSAYPLVVGTIRQALAHERILYERLSRNPRAEAFPLPGPVVARLPEDLAPEVWNFETELQALGFRFEPFGEGALRISAVPETVTDPETAFLAALHALAGGEDLAKALACKGSTRFGESLSREEMEILLKEWSCTEFSEICPHGRPIVKRLALLDLLRGFGRV